jgi:hypothetical protein
MTERQLGCGKFLKIREAMNMSGLVIKRYIANDVSGDLLM